MRLLVEAMLRGYEENKDDGHVFLYGLEVMHVYCLLKCSRALRITGM